ncbi:MAG TPA: TolC family protein [Desulfosalsimonadaceae bacterium]|nr:TolC family protein [Desulfosalsimonadaceae bacterium]
MKVIYAIFAVFVLTGCALTQPTDPYEPAGMSAPVSTEHLRGAASNSLPDRPVTLEQAIKIGLVNNPGVAARGFEADAAAARQDQALSERMPEMRVAGGYNHYINERRVLPVGQPGEPAVLSRDIVSSDLVLSMPLFTGGRLVNQVKAADLLYQSEKQRLARSRKELVFNVSSLFFNILAQRHVIEALEFSRQTLTEHLRRVDALVEGKKAAHVDRMRTEVRLADVRQELVKEKNVIDIQRRTFANLLGLSGGVDEVSLQDELARSTEAVAQDPGTALEKAWESRDDYLAEKSALEAQARYVDAARAGRWPVISLQGAYGWSGAAGQTSGKGDEFGDEGSIGLGVEIPLFEGGRVKAEIREQRAELAAAQKRLRELELQIRLEIETALADIESSEKRAAALEKTIAQARESLRIEQQRYDLGKGTIVDVLDAQDALLGAETTYYEVLAELRTAMARLKLATGEI